MLFTRLLLGLTLLVISGSSLRAETAHASQEQLQQLIVQAHSGETGQTFETRVDQQARANTLALDPNKQSWNDKDPNWHDIYIKVRSDTENDLRPMDNFATQSADKELMTSISGHLSAEDANEILAYRATSIGKDYFDFSDTVDRLITSAMIDAVETRRVSDSALSLTSDTRENYAAMLEQARSFRVVTAMQAADANLAGSKITSLILATVINKYPKELAQLFARYGGELLSFEAFNRLPSEQHFLAAMTLAMQKQNEVATQISKASEAALRQHQREWQLMYQRNVAAREKP